MAGALTKSLKRDAVRMWESRARTAEQLAGELGVSVWSLKRWAQLYRLAFRGCAPIAAYATKRHRREGGKPVAPLFYFNPSSFRTGRSWPAA
jgi:hypothetical protein